MTINRLYSFNDIPKINTGSIKLDYVLNGGYPAGRIIEISGKESSNKSILALHAIKQLQHNDGVSVYIDTDRKISNKYLSSIEIDPNKVYFAHPYSLDETIKITKSLLEQNFIDLIVIDNVSNLISEKNINNKIINYDYKLQNNQFNNFLYKISSKAKLNNTTIIFINQYRTVITNNKAKTKPLYSKTFNRFAGLRLSIKKCYTIKTDLEYVGDNAEVKIIKSPYYIKQPKVSFDIMYSSGIDNLREIIDLGLKLGIIQKSGAWYKMKDKVLGQGIEETKYTLLNDYNVLNNIITYIKEEEKDYEFIGQYTIK